VDKSSLELLAEIFIQLIIMFCGIIVIHRIITYFPTYSGIKYLEFSVTNIILSVLIIVLSLQTKLGEKVSILVDRVFELWNGPSDKKNKKGPSKSTDGAPNANMQMQTNGVGMRDMNAGMGSIMPIPPPTSMPPTQTQQLPDYNNMYRNDSNPLRNTATLPPGQGQYSMFDGPVAANEALGGGMLGGSGF
jgi:hypothetical protein